MTTDNASKHVCKSTLCTSYYSAHDTHLTRPYRIPPHGCTAHTAHSHRLEGTRVWPVLETSLVRTNGNKHTQDGAFQTRCAEHHRLAHASWFLQHATASHITSRRQSGSERILPREGTLHCIRQAKAVCGPSGSIVWRTILTCISAAALVKTLVKSDKDESSASQNPFEVAARKARDEAKVRVGIALAGKAGIEVGTRAAEVEAKAVEAANAANATPAHITRTAHDAVDRAIAAGTEGGGAAEAAVKVETAVAKVKAASGRREAVKLRPAAQREATAKLAKAVKLAAAAAELAAVEMELAVAQAIVQEFTRRTAAAEPSSSERRKGRSKTVYGSQTRWWC